MLARVQADKGPLLHCGMYFLSACNKVLFLNKQTNKQTVMSLRVRFFSQYQKLLKQYLKHLKSQRISLSKIYISNEVENAMWNINCV